MIDPSTIQLIRAIRGVPITCLFVLFCSPSPIGSMEIAATTGYDKKTISKALDALAALGVAARLSRYAGWILTDRGKQLPLPGLALNFAKPEGEILPLAPSSSSGSSLNGDTHDDVIDGEKRPLLPPSEGEFLPLPLHEPYKLLSDFLVNETGAPRGMAMSAAAATQTAQTFPAYARYQALLWLAYIQSGKGNGINNPGAFICRKIERGEECTEWFRPDHRSMTGLEARMWTRIDQAKQEWKAEDG